VKHTAPLRAALAALALAAGLALPRGAGAQDAAPALQEDPRAPKFRDVERGFFVGFEAGWLHLLDTPTSDPEAFPYAGESGGASNGLVVGVHAGVDLGSRIAVSLYGSGGANEADVNYGAFSLYSVGLDLRVSFLGRKDRNAFERFFLYAHGRGGYAKSFPAGLFAEDDVVVAGGLGVEYFTRLRHFSVGAAADYVYATKAGAGGVAVYPTLRYTF
jgi:hypothetical protein